MRRFVKWLFVLVVLLIIGIILREFFSKTSTRGLSKKVERGIKVTPEPAAHSSSHLDFPKSKDVELFVQTGHSITCALFTPDGKKVISGGWNGTIKVWDISTARVIWTFCGTAAPVDELFVSTEGRYVLSRHYLAAFTGSAFIGLKDDRRYRLWDIMEGKEVTSFQHYLDKAQPIYMGSGFKVDAQESASVDTKDGRKVGIRRGDFLIIDYRKMKYAIAGGHAEKVTAVAVSTDTQYVLSGDMGGTIKLWDATDVTRIRHLRMLIGHTKLVSTLDFSSDSRLVVSGSNDKTIRVWDTSSGRLIRTIHQYEDDIVQVMFSKCGKYFISNNADETPVLWDVTKDEAMARFRNRVRDPESFLGPKQEFFPTPSPDQKYILKIVDKSFILLDSSTGDRTKVFEDAPMRVLNFAKFSSDNRFITSFYYDWKLGTKGIAIWDFLTGKQIRAFDSKLSKPEPGAQRAIGEIGGDKIAFIASEGKNARLSLWDISTGNELKSTEILPKPSWWASCITPDGKFTLFGYDDRKMVLYDVSAEKVYREFSEESAGVSNIFISPDGRFAITSKYIDKWIPREVYLWDLAKEHPIRKFNVELGIEFGTVAFSPDGRYVLTGGANDRKIKLWDINTGTIIRTLVDHLADVWLVTFSPDGRYALSCSADNILKVCDISTGRVMWTLSDKMGSLFASFSVNGQYVISSGGDGSVVVLNSTNGKEIVRLYSFTGGEYVSIISDGYFSASKKGFEYINVRKGNDVYGLDQFYDCFYRPDIVELALKREDISKITPFNLEDALKTPPPQVEFLITPSESSDRKITIKYKVTSTGGGIGDVRVFHNGKLIQSDGFYREAKRLTPEKTLLASYDGEAIKSQLRSIAVKDRMDIIPIESKPKGEVYEGSITIEAVPGENEIGIAAFNQNNTVQSILKAITFNSSIKPEDPNLYVLAIGIDRYRESSANLKYAVKNTDDIQNRLKKQSLTLFKDQNVHTTILRNDEATKANIVSKIEELSRVIKPNDHFILYVAAHGILKQGLYSIVTHDYDGNLSQSNVINSTEIMDISKKIKSLNQLLVLDTCHAGGLDSFLSGLYDARMTVLAKNMGLHMYASANSKEAAMDGYKGNGMFTYTLLDGLNNNRSVDKNKDQKVSVEELGTYAKERTIRLSSERGHKQNPLIINFGKDVPVYLLR